MSLAYSVFKPKFKKTIADAVYQEVTSGTAIYYHWFGKENLWTDFLSPFIGSSPADYPGQPSNNFRYDLHVRRDVLTLKKIKAQDISYVVKRINWEANKVYDMYDDAIETVVGYGYAPSYSGAVTLEDSVFYILTSEFKVYKCIWNNNNSPSTVMPTSTSTTIITTEDGYKWKFMYIIPVSLRNRFLTPEWMPITTALKSQYYSSGELINIGIQNGGAGYDATQTYAAITGDGYKEINPYNLTGFLINTPVIGPANIGGTGYLVAAGKFIIGEAYKIITVGNTNFTLLGSSNNIAGTVFTATGIGTPGQTGTASLVTNVQIEDPFPDAINWTASGPVDAGVYIKYTDAGITNFYLVNSGTNLGTNPPTHTGISAGKGVSQSYTAGGGNVSLKFVGTKARANPIMTANGQSYASISIVDSGIGYSKKPILFFTPPFEETSSWQPGYTGDTTGNIIYYEGRYYEVITQGLTSPVDGPTHVSGDVLNGTVLYRFRGQIPEFTAVIEKTNAEIHLIISPPKDSVFKVTVLSAGSKYSETPVVTIANPASGSAASATASIGTGINAGKIMSITIVSVGNGYTTVPAVSIATPKITVNGQEDVNNGNNWITYNSHKFVTGDAVIYTQASGGTPIVGLTSGTTYYIRYIDDNTFRLSTTPANAASGTTIAIDGTATSQEGHTFQLLATGESAIAVASLGTGGEIVAYTLVDTGIGYTNANIQIIDPTKPNEFNDNNTGGAILVADFDPGNVETLQADVELLAIPGAVETFKIVNGGDGYTVATIEILGDGSGATATATCVGGKITQVNIINNGIGYTWTDVIITGNSGASGAEVRAIMSPLDGHGSNAIDELNAHSLSFYTSISRDINQGLEVTNDYRKVGLIRNVKEFGTNRRFSEDTGSGCVLVEGKYDPAQLLQDMLLLKDGYKKYRIVEFTAVDEFGNGQILLSVFNNFPIYTGDVLVTDPTNGGNVLDSQLNVLSIVINAVKERTIDQFSGDFLFFSVRESYSPTSEQIITVRTTVTI